MNDLQYKSASLDLIEEIKNLLKKQPSVSLIAKKLMAPTEEVKKVGKCPCYQDCFDKSKCSGYCSFSNKEPSRCLSSHFGWRIVE